MTLSETPLPLVGTRQGLKRFNICHKGGVADNWKIQLLKHTQENINLHSLL